MPEATKCVTCAAISDWKLILNKFLLIFAWRGEN
jgi:hypothetical protein